MMNTRANFIICFTLVLAFNIWGQPEKVLGLQIRISGVESSMLDGFSSLNSELRIAQKPLYGSAVETSYLKKIGHSNFFWNLGGGLEHIGNYGMEYRFTKQDSFMGSLLFPDEGKNIVSRLRNFNGLWLDLHTGIAYSIKLNSDRRQPKYFRTELTVGYNLPLYILGKIDQIYEDEVELKLSDLNYNAFRFGLLGVNASYLHTISRDMLLSIGIEAALRASLFSEHKQAAPLSLGLDIGLIWKL